MSAAVSRPRRPPTFVEFVHDELGIVLTPAQRVMSLVVFEGVDPCDLKTVAEREIAKPMFGGVDRFTPEARGAGLAIFRLGRRSGKTLLVCAARAIYRILTADLSGCGPMVPAAIIVAPRQDTAKIAMDAARTLLSRPTLRRIVIASRVGGFVLKRPQDGREVQFIIRAKGAKGITLSGYDLVEAFIDEAEKGIGGSDDFSPVNDKDLIDGGMPALTPGARINLVSTPVAAPSECARLFEENFGKPTTAIAVCATTPVMRDNDPDIMKKIERDMRRDPAVAQREYFLVLVDGAGGAFFEVSTIDHAVQPPRDPTKTKASAGLDPAFVQDSTALAVVERVGGRLQVVDLAIWSPEPQRPLVPSMIVFEAAKIARVYGCRAFATDHHKIDRIRANAANEYFEVWEGPTLEVTMPYLRDVLREGRLDIPDTELGRRLAKELKTITFVPRGNGIRIIAGRSRERGHADMVAALGMAVAFDRWQFGPLDDVPPEAPMVGGGGAPVFPGFVPGGSGFQRW